MAQFVNLTENALFEILALLSGEELLEACGTNTQIANICNSSGLWRLKVEEEFPTVLETVQHLRQTRSEQPPSISTPPSLQSLYDVISIPGRQQYKELLRARLQAADEIAPLLSTVFPDPDNIQPNEGYIYYLVSEWFPLLYKDINKGLHSAHYRVEVVVPRSDWKRIRPTYRFKDNDGSMIEKHLSYDVTVNVMRVLRERGYRMITKRYLDPRSFEYYQSLGLVAVGTDPISVA